MSDKFRVFKIGDDDTGTALRTAIDMEDVCCLGGSEVSRIPVMGVMNKEGKKKAHIVLEHPDADLRPSFLRHCKRKM